MQDNSFIQVISKGIIYIRKDKINGMYETTSKIIAATSNERQIVLGLEDREIVYFELEDDKLKQVEIKVLDSEVQFLNKLRSKPWISLLFRKEEDVLNSSQSVVTITQSEYYL
jgi:hypothetical protein